MALQDIIPAFFVGPNGEPLSPEQIKQRQQVAQSLLQQATDTSPNAGGWASILSKGALGLASGFQSGQADRAETANSEYNSGLLGSLFSGQAPATATPAYPSSVAAGGSGTAPAAVNMPTGDAPERIKAKLIERGLPEHVADGFVMNIADESGFNAGINEANPVVAGSRGGFGLYQLTGPRRRAYEAYAQQRGLPLDSEDAQLDFLVAEGRGPEAAAFQKILSAPTAGTAAAAIVNNFLRPAPEHRTERANRYLRTASVDGGAEMANAALMPAEPNPNPTVAEALLGGGARTGEPMLVYDDQGMRMEGVATPVSLPTTEGVGVANTPVGSGGTPILDVTQQPSLSAAAGLPFAGGGAVQPVSAPVQPAPSVAEALAIRPQADPNDRMVAGADQTLQPTQAELSGVFPPAPAQPDQSMQLQRVIADPRASPQTKQVAMGLLQQQQRVAQQAQAAQVEQQQWLARQQYEQNVRQNDPLIQAQTRKAQAEADAFGKPTVRQLTAAEIAQQGLDPKKSYQQSTDGRITAIGDAGVNVSVNTGQNTSKFIEESDKKAAERFDGYIAGGRQATQQISDMQTLAELGKQITTGAGAQALLALGPYAEMAGIKLEGLGPAQAYKSIIDRLAPAMRVPGSGSSSDIDVRMFLNSLPNIGNSPEANAVINGTFQSIAQNKQAAADLALQAQNGGMTWQEAEKQISALPNPYENFKKFRKDNPTMFGGEVTDTPSGTDGWRDLGNGVKIRPKGAN